jgi:hypothetical protein
MDGEANTLGIAEDIKKSPEYLLRKQVLFGENPKKKVKPIKKMPMWAKGLLARLSFKP